MSLLIFFIVTKWYRNFSAYSLAFVLAIRCIATLVLLHLVETKTYGFQLIDRK